MALPDLSGIALKLQQACNQLDSLKQEIAAFLDGDPYSPSVEFHTKQGENLCITDFAIRMVVNKPCDPLWSIKIGEIVHDLRCALDHTVYQLYVFLHGEIPPATNRNQFPIFLSSAEFQKSGLPMLKEISQKATALVESLQPFATRENASSPLWHLNKLSNIDKHRTIHLTGGSLEAFNFEFPPLVNPGRMLSKNVSQRGAFHHNTAVVTGTFVAPGHPFGGKQVKVNAGCLFDIVFDERTPVVGEWSVIRTLIDIADRVADIIERIQLEIFGIDARLPRVSQLTRPK